MYSDTFEYAFYDERDDMRGGACHIEDDGDYGVWLCELYATDGDSWESCGSGDTWEDACEDAMDALPFSLSRSERDDFIDHVYFTMNERMSARRKTAGDFDWFVINTYDTYAVRDYGEGLAPSGYMAEVTQDGYWFVVDYEEYIVAEGHCGSPREGMSAADSAARSMGIKGAMRKRAFSDTFEYLFFGESGESRGGECHIEYDDEFGVWVCELYGINGEQWESIGSDDTWEGACVDAVEQLPFALSGKEFDDFITHVDYMLNELY